MAGQGRRTAPGGACVDRRHEVIFSAQDVIAPEVVGAASELVAAALGDDIDLGAAGAGILRSIAVARNLELLDAIDGGIDQDGALRANIVVAGAVNPPLVGIGRRATERDVDAGEEPFVLIVETGIDRRPRQQRGQLHKVAAVQRQLAHLLAQHGVGDCAGLGLDQHGRGFHIHILGADAYLQLHVERSGIGHVQREVALGYLLEARLVDSHCVRSRFKVSKAVIALTVALDRTAGIGGSIHHINGRLWHYSAGRIGNGAGNCSCGFLGLCSG